MLSYLGITYKRNEIISDVIQWFEDSIDFLNYGNSRQELRTAIAKTNEVKRLFGLLPFRAKSLVTGTTLVIDELDAKVHPV